MAMVRIECAYCRAAVLKPPSHINRSGRRGAPVYCGRECSGLGRRVWKSVQQRRAEKSAYDAQRRIELADRIKAEKAAYHKRTYDPAKAAVERQKRMPYHLEYCRRPEYREYKRDYDRKYRAEKEFGEFAECFLLIQDIRTECLAQQTDYEIRLSKGGIAKSQKRRREYDRLVRKEPEIGPLGNLELGERR